MKSETTLSLLPPGGWYEANLTLGPESIILIFEGKNFSPYTLAINGLNHSQSGKQLFFGNIVNALEDDSLLSSLPHESGVDGCIRNVMFNSSGVVNLEDGISFSYPAVPGCPREAYCFPNPCENEGVCVSNWEGYICDCGQNYLGQNCTEGMYMTMQVYIQVIVL